MLNCFLRRIICLRRLAASAVTLLGVLECGEHLRYVVNIRSGSFIRVHGKDGRANRYVARPRVHARSPAVRQNHFLTRAVLCGGIVRYHERIVVVVSHGNERCGRIFRNRREKLLNAA